MWRVCICVCVRVCLAGVCLCVCPVPTHTSALGVGKERRGFEDNSRKHSGCEAPSPLNQMQISINSINGQCLLAIKIAQRLLVSGSKMDDQWPQRSQRSKMTITLKCNLCWPPAPDTEGGVGAADRQWSLPNQAALSHAASSAPQPAFGHQGLCVCLSILSSPRPVPLSFQAKSPHVRPATAVPHDIPRGAVREQGCGLAFNPTVPLH